MHNPRPDRAAERVTSGPLVTEGDFVTHEFKRSINLLRSETAPVATISNHKQQKD